MAKANITNAPHAPTLSSASYPSKYLKFIEQWDSNFCSKSFAITLVDLAGSERLVSSSQSPSETGFINKSLFQLANVISKLA